MMKAPYAAFHCFTGSVIEIDSSFQTIMPAKSSKPGAPVKKSGNFAWIPRIPPSARRAGISGPSVVALRGGRTAVGRRRHSQRSRCLDAGIA